MKALIRINNIPKKALQKIINENLMKSLLEIEVLLEKKFTVSRIRNTNSKSIL